MASAAYRAGEKLYSERYGETSDYTRKCGVVCSGILLPEHAPKEYADRQTLKKGIRTEIGDYNRFVRQLNAVIRETERKLKDLREWLQTAREELNQLPTPEEPSLAWVVQEQLNNLPSRSKSLRHVQEASQALIDLQEMGITNADELDAIVTETSKFYDELTERVKNNEARVKKLEEAIKQAAIYKKYLPVKQALNEPRLHFEKARKKYEAEHDSELTLFKAAQGVLKKFNHGKQWTDTTVAGWKKEVAELKASLEKEAPQVKVARDEMLKLRGIQGTLESYLKPRRERNHEQER